jgi:glycosyltransferase involved in cell wall biosynthesis
MAVGGAPRHVLTTLARLDRSRFRIALATGTPEPGEGDLVPEVERLGIQIHRIPSLRREIRPLDDLKAFIRLYRLIRRERYRIVHTHLSKAGIIGRIAAWLAGAHAIMHTYHGDVFEGYFGLLKSRILLCVERLVGACTHRFVSVSQPLLGRLRSRRIGSPSRFVTILNGVDESAFRPSAVRSGEPGLRVGTAAMFFPIKRVDLFVDAALDLLARRRDIRFEIAGGGQEASALERAAAPAGDGIRFLGLHSEMSGLLATWDMFVLCSDYESAGISLVEAMLMGLPVVATRVGGVPDIVADGTTGILVQPGDAKAVAEAVDRLVCDSGLRRRMGEAGRRRALKHFTSDRMVAQLSTLYDGLGGRRPL